MWKRDNYEWKGERLAKKGKRENFGGNMKKEEKWRLKREKENWDKTEGKIGTWGEDHLKEVTREKRLKIRERREGKINNIIF